MILSFLSTVLFSTSVFFSHHLTLAFPLKSYNVICYTF